MRLYLILGLIGVIFLAGCTQATTTSTFTFGENNLDLVSVSWKDKLAGIGGIETTVKDQCKALQCKEKNWSEVGCSPPIEPWLDKYQESPVSFVFNVKAIPETEKYASNLKESLKCYVLFDNVRKDFRGNEEYLEIGLTGIHEFSSGGFFEYLDIMESHSVTLCCEGICKTKTIEPYCK